MSEKPNLLTTITKVILIGGAIILFILLAIWIVRWVPKAISGLSNIGDSVTSGIRGGETIEVDINQEEINSGDNFVVSFDYSPSEAGEYYISYSCKESLVLDIQSSNGPRRIVCNTPFRLGEDLGRVSLVPTLSKQNSFTDTEVKISYQSFENDEEIAFGTSVATIKNTENSDGEENPFNANLAGSTVTSAPAETNTTPVQTNYTGSTGQADLTITNIARTEGRSALSFTVYNYGSRSTDNWYFSYTDAENPTRTLTSPIQPSLAPGQGLFIQVRFDGQRYDNQLVSIYVDSTNTVPESNEGNNRSSVVINGNEYEPYYYDIYYYYDEPYYYYDNNDEADLVIEDLEVGYMRGSRFVENDTIDEDDEAAVRFTVINKGGESTGRWDFEIRNTPYDDDDDYNSGSQSSLRPGERETITIEFDNPDEGDYNIRVELDPDDDIDEENERNNTDSKRLRVRN